MERIDYETYTRRAGSLRSQAIADVNRAIIRMIGNAYHSARRALGTRLAARMNSATPTPRAC